MRLRHALLAATLIVAPIAAGAQPIEGLYVGAGVGANLPQNVRATPSAPGFGGSHLRLEKKLGFDLTGSVGYGLGGGFRIEIEGDYLRNAVHELGRTSFPTAASGHVRTYGLMANALYDFDIRSRYVFPYLGVGAGYMWTRFDNVAFTGPAGGISFGDHTGSGKFAWQAIAGLSLPVPNRPGLSLLAQYRLLDVTAGERFSGTSVTATGARSTQLKLGPQFSHTFLLGVRYAFNVTPPPAPAAPVPAPVAAPAPRLARSYLVFFDWDKATLTERARQIIREAAEASTRVKYTQLKVNGYTDTSGPARYNQALSMRRAKNVAAELVRDGVPRNAISIHGFGETHLLVPTGPGVREPQNRRVEIIIA